jgi:hypothetical protein
MQSAAATVDPFEPDTPEPAQPPAEETPFTLKNVFISYAHEDQELARRLADDLRKKCGAKVWLDLELRTGHESWPKQLQDAFDAASEFVLVVSPAAMSSPYVQGEWAAARDREMPIIPILRRPLETPSIFLSGAQYIDFARQDYEKAFQDLLIRATSTRKLFIQKYVKPYLPALAVVATIAAGFTARYQLSPSDTRFTVVDASKSEIVLRVDNHGGKPSMLLGGTFKLDFGKLPIEPEELILLDPGKAARIDGHSDDTRIRFKRVHLLTPKKKDARSYFTESEVMPLVPGATLTVTGQVKESGERLRKRTINLPGARLQEFIQEGFPDEVSVSRFK